MTTQQTVRDEMKKLLTPDHKLEAVASLWLERWSTLVPEAGRAPWSPDTVVSNISALKHGNQRGVKFFGTDPRRLEVLFDVLDAPSDARQRIRGTIQQLLDPEGGLKAAAMPCVIVDVSSMGDKPNDQLIDQLIERIVNNQTHETIFVVTDAFYEGLRLSVSSQAHKLEFKKAPNAEQCWDMTLALANERAALVVAVKKYEPVTHWLGAVWDGQRLCLTPNDGIALFLEAGALPSLPVPLMPLNQLYKLDRDRISDRCYWEPFSRDLLSRLQAGDESLGEPHDRMALAARAGVVAGATIREITRALSRQEVNDTTLPVLERCLARAHRVTVENVVVWVAGKAHVINPGQKWPQEVLEHPDIECHHIQPQPSAAHRIGVALASLTYDHHIDSPLLSNILGESETDLSSRSFARLCWLRHGFAHARARRPVDMQASLAALLEAPLGAVDLLIVPQPSWFVAPRDLLRGAEGSALLPGAITGRYPIHCQRGQALVVLQQQGDWIKLLADPTNEPRWNEALDRWNDTRRPEAWELEQFVIPKSIWRQADLDAALALDALQQAANTAAVLPGGDVRLSVAEGIVARVSIREHASERVGCALLQPLKSRSYERGSMVTHVPLLRGIAADCEVELGPSVPQGLYLMAKGLRADVTFHAHPFSVSQKALHASAAMVGASVADLKRRQRDDEYYDDDDDD